MAVDRASDPMDRRRCGAPTLAGGSCRNWAAEDGRCRVHARAAVPTSVDEPTAQAPTLTTFTAGATGRRRHVVDGLHRTPARFGPPAAAHDDRPDDAAVAAEPGAADDPPADGRGAAGDARTGDAPPRGQFDRMGAPRHAPRGAREAHDVLDALADVLGSDVAGHLDGIAAFMRRRLTGDYDVDHFGMDPDLYTHVFKPLLRPLYDTWWRVTSHGRQHLPDGGGLLVANHAGTLPFDGLMLNYDVHDATGRPLRELGADLVFETPFVGHFARKSGAVRAAREDADAVLDRGELAGVFPEGFKGLGKPFSQRYQLGRFGRGGFVATALRAGVPIVPVAIVGSEEIYPMLWDAKVVARALGLPYFPVVAQMLALPLVGPLGLVPLPTKWSITYGEPIHTAGLGPRSAEDPMVVFDLADRVRETIQQMLVRQVMGRRSVFF